MERTQEQTDFHLMTSCDRALLPYVSVQLVSLSDAMPDVRMDFYLFHRGLAEADLRPLRALCDVLDNVRFHDIVVKEPEKYDLIASRGCSQEYAWCGEAYFSLCAHEYLPDSVSRVMYLDAGDVLVVDDIAPFYNSPFCGKALTVHPSKLQSFSMGGTTLLLPLTEQDLDENYDEICKEPALFNSGSYVINLARLRAEKLTVDDFVLFSDELCAMCGREHEAYWGDQGFLSAAYVGDLNLFRYPEICSVHYRPYNFGMFYYFFFDHDPEEFCPAVIHFCGGRKILKPWQVEYGKPLPRFLNPNAAKLEQPLMEKWYRLWFSAAERTDRLLTDLGL